MTAKVLIAGASGGIGAAVAAAAVAAGLGVVLGYGAGRDRAERLAEDLRTHGGTVLPLPLPLTDEAALSTALAGLPAHWIEGLDTLVHCASPLPRAESFLKTSTVAFDEHWRVSVQGSHRLLAECWKRLFRPKRRGHLVILSSIAVGPPPAPHMIAYVTAKAGLESLTRGAVRELGGGGLSATILRPDYVETPMLQAFPEMFLQAERDRRGERGFLSAQTVAQAVLTAVQAPPPPGEVNIVDVV